ncbi:MAG: hypothetical protein Q4C49_07150 [Bacillota bacterium]|nr:hypothetical protein [Bacillota bacterium]
MLNYVFRKTGVKIRIYAQHVQAYESILNGFPNEMKKDIIKGGICKRLIGGTCSPTCTAGYKFTMDGIEYIKCKNNAFFHTLSEANFDAILALIHAEVECSKE